MKYEDWKPLYKEILRDFGFSEREDVNAAKILKDSIKSDISLKALEKKICNKRVNVYGAGPSLEKVKIFPKGTNIAADGATSYLLEKGVVPDIIVTDLDGKIEDLLEANKNGGIVVIHAHGDNVAAIKRYAGKFSNCIATTQTVPFEGVYNFGGFTDGDRAVFLAEHFSASEIFLYGMDFRGEIGKYSLSKNKELTKKKLLWAEKLINILKDSGAKILKAP